MSSKDGMSKVTFLQTEQWEVMASCYGQSATGSSAVSAERNLLRKVVVCLVPDLMKEIKELRAKRETLARQVRKYKDALNWIATVYALDHEYQKIARAALAESAKQMEEKPYIDPLDGTRLVDAEGNRL